jgi:hypothetical protein
MHPAMSRSDPDPQPGDFDAELARAAPQNVEVVEPFASAAVSIEVVVRGDDAAHLERLTSARGRKPGELVAQLLRDAD